VAKAIDEKGSRIRIVLTENGIVLTIVELIDLGRAASFDRVQPYMMLNSLLVGLRGHAAILPLLLGKTAPDTVAGKHIAELPPARLSSTTSC